MAPVNGGIEFDWTINLGDVLQAIVFVGGAVLVACKVVTAIQGVILAALKRYREQLMDEEAAQMARGENTQSGRLITLAMAPAIERMEGVHARDIAMLSNKLQNLVEGQQSLGRQIEAIREGLA